MAFKVGARPILDQRCSTFRGRTLRDDGVSEIMGSILMVGITVVMASAFVLFILAVNPGPVDSTHTDLSVTVDRGDGGWGDGDERVIVQHRGGEALYSNSTTIHIEVGAVINEYRGATLDFSDDNLTVGETWIKILNIPPASAVSFAVVEDQGDPTVLTTGALKSGTLDCSTDSNAPVVSSFSSEPSDVTALTSTKVDIRFKINDDCTGVDAVQTASGGQLKYRVPGSTDLDSWTTTPIQQIGATAFWNATIPVTDWSPYDGLTLKVIVENVADNLANTGNSSVYADAIQSSTAWLTSCQAIEGTISTCPGAMIGQDTATETFTETSTTILTDIPLAGESTITSGVFTEPVADAGCIADGQWASHTQGGGSSSTMDPIRCTVANSGASTSIDSVVVHAIVRSDTEARAEWTLRACDSASSSCTAASPALQGGGDNVESDISHSWALAPDGGAWTWTDINNLEIEVKPLKTGGGNVLFEVDRVSVVVTEGTPTYDLNVRVNVDNVLPGSTYTLQIGYKANGEDFNVEVWDATNGAWNQRGAVLDSATLADWPDYVLTDDEIAGDLVRIRIVDSAPADATESSIDLDYVRVVTT